MNKSTIEQKIKTLNTYLSDIDAAQVNRIILQIASIIRHGNKIVICGNGGSACEASHFCCQLVVKLKDIRPSYPAICLNQSGAIISAISNDFGQDFIFSRQVQSMCSSGDILFVISTSGNSKNIIKAIEQAKKKEVYVIGLLGAPTGQANSMCDSVLAFNGNDTQAIQQAHLFIIHTLCKGIEDELS